MAKAASKGTGARAKRGTRIASKSKAANNNFAPTGRDQVAMYFAAAMIDARMGEVRRAPDQRKIVQRAFDFADIFIEESLGSTGE